MSSTPFARVDPAVGAKVLFELYNQFAARVRRGRRVVTLKRARAPQP